MKDGKRDVIIKYLKDTDNLTDSVYKIDDIAKLLGVSVNYIYRVIRELSIDTPFKKYLEIKKSIFKDKSVTELLDNTEFPSKDKIYSFNARHKINKFYKLNPTVDRRHDKVIHLLKTTDLSYTEIANITEYKSISSISRINIKYGVKNIKIKRGV